MSNISVIVNDSNNITAVVDQGVIGPSGASATVAVGTTTTLSPGASATVSNSGTSSAAVLNFGIPQGPVGATGATGATGAQGNPGIPGINWLGTWSSGTTYAIRDAVAYNGSSYYAIAISTNQAPPNASFWNLLAERGTNGTGSGTVTSVDVSGGTTGLTTSGGPVTAAGTITLAGTLAVANGGTGVTTSTGTGANVLSTSPALTTPSINLINDTSGNEILGLSPTASATDYLTVKNGIGVGVPLHVYADGSSANIGLHIQPKGTGLVTISDGTDFNKGIRFRSSGSGAGVTTLIDAVSSAGHVVTLPNATTTLVGRDTTDTLTNKTFGDNPTLSAGTANGVTYLNGSKVLTTGSALVFDSADRLIVGAGSAAVGNRMEVVPTGNGGAIAVRGRSADALGYISWNANAASTEYARITSDNTSSLYFGLGASGSEQMRLTSTGLGIGTASPAAKLDVAGDYKEGVVTANTGTAYTISLASGTVQILTLTGNCTFTFPTATAGKSFTLLLRQDGTGSRTVTWPAAVKWPGGTAPTITSTASRQDKFIFTADSSSWFGSNAGQNYSF